MYGDPAPVAGSSMSAAQLDRRCSGMLAVLDDLENARPMILLELPAGHPTPSIAT
jgi:hypothetical protein